MSTTSNLDEDGVQMIFGTLSGGLTYRLGSTKNPNTESLLTLDEGGSAEEHTGSTTHVHYWIYTGGPVSYASGGSGRTCRVTLRPSGTGPQQFDWRNGAIQHGFILNDQDIRDGEFTIYLRPEGLLNVHTECSMKIRGGVHSSNDDGSPNPKASCIELRVPMSGQQPQAARELDHPNYDFINLTPKFTASLAENVWIGIKVITYNKPDSTTQTINQMYLDTDPFDPQGKPKNTWKLYTEWTDDSAVDTGQYTQAAVWAGWLWTLRVDGWQSINFTLPSVREIDPNNPLAGGGITCQAGQHFDPATQQCVPDPITCPTGQVFSTQFNKCIPICASGQHYDDTQGKCVDDNTPSGPPPDPTCPPGTHFDPFSRRCESDPTGKVADNALAFFYSGGVNVSEANAAQSTGGFISNVQITSSDLNNLFTSINGPEGTVPTTQYRCIYVKNISDQTAYSVRAYLFTPNADRDGTLSPDTFVRAGIGQAGKNKIELFLSDPTKPPVGVCIGPYYNPIDKYIWLGKMFPNETFPIWIERRSKAHLRTWSRDQTMLVAIYDETVHDPTVIPNLCADGANTIPCPTGMHFDFALNECISDTTPPPTCPPGQHYDTILGQCVDDSTPTPCPTGQHFDTAQGKCVPDTPPPITCDPGTHFDPVQNKCVPNDSLPCDSVPPPSVGPDNVAQIYATLQAPATAAAPRVSTLDSFDTGQEG